MACRLRCLAPLGILLSFLILLPQAAWPFDLGSRIQDFTLKNGLRLLVVERTLSPTVSAYIRFRAGAVDEADGLTGAAHLLEHMLFKGTESIGSRDPAREREIMRRIDQVGKALDRQRRSGRSDPALVSRLSAQLKTLQEEHRKRFRSNEIDRLYTEQGAVQLNASTGQDLTTYHVNLPANRLELWARIESDRMTRPLFREFYSERDVVLEERRQRSEADPEGLLYERYLAGAFTVHPYRRPIIGRPDEIPFVGPDDLRQFFQRTHAPNQMVIALVGAVKPTEALTLVQHYFGWIPARRQERPALPAEPPQQAERRIAVPFPADPQLIMGFHKPPPPAPADDAFDLLESILTRGKTSRLYRTIVEAQGLAKSVQAYNGLPGIRYPNQFTLFAVPRYPHTCEEVETAITAEIEALQQHPVPEAELNKVKRQIETDFLRGLNSNAGLAGMLSYYEAALGDHRYLLRYPETIGRITAAQVQEAAATYLRRENRTVVTLVRTPPP